MQDAPRVPLKGPPERNATPAAPRTRPLLPAAHALPVSVAGRSRAATMPREAPRTPSTTPVVVGTPTLPQPLGSKYLKVR